MTNNIQKEKQLTIAQYLVEVIENKAIFQPYEKFSLFIDANEFDLIKPVNQKEHDFYKHVLESYIKFLYNKIDEFHQIKHNDQAYKRLVSRTLKRLIKTLQKQNKKSDIAINWAIKFHMPVYGIDIYRQKIEQKKGLNYEINN